MEKIIIDGIEYVYLRKLYNKKYDRYLAALHKNGKYYRMWYHTWLWMVENKKHITKGYVIHHINKDHKDNRIENLLLVSRGEHNKLHADDQNHYMFREGHTYWSKPKSEEHKTRIKYAHIERANKNRLELVNNAILYIKENIDCTAKDVVYNSGATHTSHFKRRFGMDFLTLKDIAIYENNLLGGKMKTN